MREYTTCDGYCPACGRNITCPACGRHITCRACGSIPLVMDCPHCGREVILWERVSDHDDGAGDYSGA